MDELPHKNGGIVERRCFYMSTMFSGKFWGPRLRPFFLFGIPSKLVKIFRADYIPSMSIDVHCIPMNLLWIFMYNLSIFSSWTFHLSIHIRCENPYETMSFQQSVTSGGHRVADGDAWGGRGGRVSWRIDMEKRKWGENTAMFMGKMVIFHGENGDFHGETWWTLKFGSWKV